MEALDLVINSEELLSLSLFTVNTRLYPVCPALWYIFTRTHVSCYSIKTI